MNGQPEHESILQSTRSDAASFWMAVSSIAACIAALFAGWAALETRNSALEANRATRAAVWLQVLGEYASPEILASMKNLRAWQQQRPNDFAENFKSILNKSNRTEQEERLANSLDMDRRRVSQFFRKLEVLCQGGILDEEFVSKQWSFSTYPFISDVVMPMEKAKADALLETKSITQEERAAGNRTMEEELEFYRRLSQRAFFDYSMSHGGPNNDSSELYGLPSP